MACKSYKRYSKEFKVEALRLVEDSDKPVTQVARELGLRQNQIYRWRKELESKGGVADVADHLGAPFAENGSRICTKPVHGVWIGIVPSDVEKAAKQEKHENEQQVVRLCRRGHVGGFGICRGQGNWRSYPESGQGHPGA